MGWAVKENPSDFSLRPHYENVHVIGTLAAGLPVHLQGKPDELVGLGSLEALHVRWRREVAAPLTRTGGHSRPVEGPDLGSVNVHFRQVERPPEGSADPVGVREILHPQRLVE